MVPPIKVKIRKYPIAIETLSQGSSL